jgi:hypothetical protein
VGSKIYTISLLKLKSPLVLLLPPVEKEYREPPSPMIVAPKVNPFQVGVAPLTTILVSK